jgi:two-component system, OmpR family, phosphate regulon sensor histidine kinase PhoR
MHTRRLWPLVTILSVPAVAIFVVLVVAQAIPVLPALAAMAALAGITALLLKPYIQDLEDVARFARDLQLNEEGAAPSLRTDIANDILTALKLARRQFRGQSDELAARLKFHETLFDSLPSPILLLDPQRRIVGENAAARKLFGRQQRDRDLAALLRHPDLLDAADKVLAGEAGGEVELTLTSPVTGEYRAMVEPLLRPGSAAAAVLSLHDITALKRVEQMRADFIANASHELRTPLAAVLGFIETLRGPARGDDDAYERFLGIMYEQATRMSRLVADLLNLSRIELHEHSRPEGMANVGAILRRVATGLELTASEKLMKIDLDVDESLPSVIGQEDELTQIFQNLLDNALKYGREGTPVLVTARQVTDLPLGMPDKSRPAVMVTVKDHGEGIAREHLPRLTERFFRVDTARSRRLGGTGLGLAIVKHVVNRHRGCLQVESELGQGTIFTVYLPVAS